MADNIVWAICVIHNFLIEEMEEETDFNRVMAAFQSWRGISTGLTGEDANANAKDMRKKLVEFFNGVGSVDFQEEMI
uniref:Uncharacterized protein n=1 Tax=Ditylenchus dipsaci TaxID=166011 RepID=A0A915E1G6_9BILA